jgi:GTPase
MPTYYLILPINSDRLVRITHRLPREFATEISETASYHTIGRETGSIELVVAPGTRKLWKWSDYALTDADIAAVVVRPDISSVPVEDLLEPLFLALGHGIESIAVILNLSSNTPQPKITETELVIKEDLHRVFGGSHEVPILRVNLNERSSLLALERDVWALHYPARNTSEPPFMCVNGVFQKENFVVIEGKLRVGTVNRGDKLFLMPAGLELVVAAVRNSRGVEVEKATAGELVALRFDGISKSHIPAGMVLVGDICVGKSTRRIRAQVSFVNNKFPIKVGFSPVLSLLSCQVHGNITEIHGDLTELTLGSNAEITISLQKTVFTAPYSVTSPIRGLGRIVLRQENVVIGIGVVRAVLD